MPRFSPEQLKKAGPEAQDLLAQAKEQLEDHKRWMERSFAVAGREGRVEAGLAQILIAEVDSIALKLVRPEPELRDLGKPTITVAFDYPDRLYDFLRSEECPAELKIALHGAITIDEQSTTKVEMKT